MHIGDTVERIKDNAIVVKGYKFPRKFSYSIKILLEDGTKVNPFDLYVALAELGIAPEIRRSDTLSVDE